MFFFLSKTISYLVKPLVIVTVLLLASWIIRNQKWKRWLFIASLALLFFFSNEFISNEVMKAWEIPATPFSQLNKKYDYGILLCGAAKSGLEPTDRVYMGSGADRVNHTLQLYKLGFIKKILISGGSGRLIDIGQREADDLSSLLQLMGVPVENIIVENNSRNTHESAMEVKKLLLSESDPSRCILVTSAYHMRRSLGCFAKVGWTVDGFSADFQTHKRTYDLDVLIIPKLEGIGAWQILLREWTGYASYWVMGYL